MTKRDYLIKLRKLYELIPNEFEKEIFYILCKKYQNSLKDITESKFVTKEEIIRCLIDKGLMKMSFDKNTKEERLPDDRGIRNAVRKLMKNGLPILSSSINAGYYICDNTTEIKQPYEENKKRALSILARQKGFEIMQNFVLGQVDITEINLNIDNEED